MKSTFILLIFTFAYTYCIGQQEVTINRYKALKDTLTIGNELKNNKHVTKDGNNIIKFQPSFPTFQKILFHDITLVAGLDDKSAFKSNIKVAIVDDPTLKLNLAFNKGPKTTNDLKAFFSLGAEFKIPENIATLAKTHKPDFDLTITPTLMVFAHNASRYKYDTSKMRPYLTSIDNVTTAIYDPSCTEVNEFDINNPSGKLKQILTTDGKGNLVYYTIDETRDKTIADLYYKAPYNTKKFHWFTIAPIIGLSSVNLYDKTLDSLSSKFVGKGGLDVAYNFFHFINSKYTGNNAWGTKFIQLGLSVVYSRPEDVDKEKYFSYDDTSTVNKKTRKVTMTDAYDMADYSPLVTGKAHFDFYDFFTKSKIVGIHLGTDYLVRYKIDPEKFGTGDMNFRAGIVFSLPSCTGDCDDADKTSLANFELLFSTDNLLGAYRDGKSAGDVLKIQVKVGIPFALMK